jgi:hypothetical protein
MQDAVQFPCQLQKMQDLGAFLRSVVEGRQQLFPKCNSLVANCQDFRGPQIPNCEGRLLGLIANHDFPMVWLNWHDLCDWAGKIQNWSFKDATPTYIRAIRLPRCSRYGNPP